MNHTNRPSRIRDAEQPAQKAAFWGGEQDMNQTELERYWQDVQLVRTRVQARKRTEKHAP